MNPKTRLQSSFLPLAVLAVLASCSTEPADPVDASKPDAVSTTDATAEPAAGSTAAATDSAAEGSATSIYTLKAPSLAGDDVDLSDYVGKVSLVVNVASQCGYTRQYAGLQELHTELQGRGFQVLGFPSNDFGGQEPGSADEIAAFCSDKFGVTFPMFAKVTVKGADPAPVYRRLAAATGETPSWNFCKYLVGKNGEVLGYWKSGTGPDSAELRDAIEKAL